ncbi:MAG: nucleotidyltransferase domain-containing protein [Acidobacteriota bacterium]
MPAARELAIPIPHERIAEFCRKWGIRKLSFFGSVVRDDFDPERSDVDVLVEYQVGTDTGLFDIIHAEQELSRVLGRKVDLVDSVELRASLKPYVLSELVEEYVEEG